MKQVGEQAASTQTLDDEQVVQYLLTHPDFFIRNAQMVEQMVLPHPGRGLGLAGAHVRLFSDQWQLGAPSGFTTLALARSALEPLRIQLLGPGNHYRGKINSPELLLPHVLQVGSVAMSLLGDDGSLGVLMFTSCDSQHFQEGMGTVLLQQLSTLSPGLLERWVSRG